MNAACLGEEYERASRISRRIAAEVGPSLFERERRAERERSARLYASAPVVRMALNRLAGKGDQMGHGLAHAKKVAVDAGALVLIEPEPPTPGAALAHLVFLSHLAGILHDIRRREADHARAGAQEAAEILASFPLDDRDRRRICLAIGNHEAFRQALPADDATGQRLSDALYDADKFRWGPDNFTHTIWAMLSPPRVSLAELMPRFLRGLEGVARIRETFRTAAGRRYGPDFIDRGLEIGRRLHRELTAPGRTGGR